MPQEYSDFTTAYRLRRVFSRKLTDPDGGLGVIGG
jgi:hypothetical protein